MPVVQKHNLMLQLPEERRKEVSDMLRRGDPLIRIAKEIQMKWQLLTAVKQEALVKAIARWRDDAVQSNVITSLIKEGAIDPDSKLVKQIDVLAEMTMAFQLQKMRLLKAYERESTMPLLMDQVRKEMETTALMLKQIAQLQMETGVIRKVPSTKTFTPNPDGSMTVKEEFRHNSESEKLIEMFLQKAEEYQNGKIDVFVPIAG